MLEKSKIIAKSLFNMKEKNQRSIRLRKKLHKRYIEDIRYVVLSSKNWQKKISVIPSGEVIYINDFLNDIPLVDKYNLKYCMVKSSTKNEDIEKLCFFCHEFKKIYITAFVTKMNSKTHVALMDSFNKRMSSG